MKTKFTIVLTALFLLVGICANAQVKDQTPKWAESETPIKGDVNGDGVVDVADIAAIIEIMKNKNNGGGDGKNYFYVGTTKPTSLSQASTVTSYAAEQTYTNNSGAKAHIFVLTNSDKNVTFIEPSENSPITQASVDTTTISGYKIFETAVGVANTKSIIIKISEK